MTSSHHDRAGHDVIAHVVATHGEAGRLALAPWEAHGSLRLERRGPLAWIVTGVGGVPDALFFVDGAWRVLTGHAAFQQVLADALPPLAPWEPLVQAWQALTLHDVLVTRDDVDDAAHPGFVLFPLSPAARERWEPPAVVDGVLRFMSFGHGQASIVRIDGRTLAVDVTPI
jgi:hypothetical protein